MKKIIDNKIFRFIYGTIKTLFIIIVIIYVGFLLIQRFSSNSNVMGYRIYKVASPSMVPVYDVNDILLIKEVDTSTLKVGDDITYMGEKLETTGKIITHRIIDITEDNGQLEITTKGVANDESDPSITTSQIYGKVLCELKPISIINSIISSKVGFFFLLFVPFVAIIFIEILDTVKGNDIENVKGKKTKRGKKGKKTTKKK